MIHILTRASNPVAFFLILGGYGMYKVWEKKDKHRWVRPAKLFLHYWIILIVFISIGYLLYPNRYPGTALNVLNNMTGFHTTYNGEMWFLLPYLILSIISHWLFRISGRIRCWQVIVITFAIHICTSYCISRYGVSYLYNNYWLYNPLLVFHLMFNFFLGAMAARSHFFEKLKEFTNGITHIGEIAWGGVIVCIVIACIFHYFYCYAFLFIAFFLLARRPAWFDYLLAKLGQQSMNMWMIHSWLCYYLFHDFFYGLKYPIVIFTTVVVVSYLIGCAIDKVLEPIDVGVLEKQLRKKD